MLKSIYKCNFLSHNHLKNLFSVPLNPLRLYKAEARDVESFVSPRSHQSFTSLQKRSRSSFLRLMQISAKIQYNMNAGIRQIPIDLPIT